MRCIQAFIFTYSDLKWCPILRHIPSLFFSPFIAFRSWEFQWKDFKGQQLLSNYGMQWGISHISQKSSLCHELCLVTVHSNERALCRCQYKQEKPSSLTSVHDLSLQGSHVVPRGGCCLALTTMTSSLRSPLHQSFGRKGIHNPVQRCHVKATCETPK